jgi:hypothetical protein
MTSVTKGKVYTIKGGGNVVTAQYAHYMTVPHPYEVLA